MRIGAAIIIALLSESCGERPREIEVNVVSVERGSIVLMVRNRSGEDVVLLSPATPSRQVDDERCTVWLSTKVDERLWPYAFTPQLVTVAAGSKKTFRASIHPLRLSKACRHWHITAEYAYIRPEAAKRFAGRPSEEFRRSVLRNQRLVSTRASATIETGDELPSRGRAHFHHNSSGSSRNRGGFLRSTASCRRNRNAATKVEGLRFGPVPRELSDGDASLLHQRDPLRPPVRLECRGSPSGHSGIALRFL